MRSTGRFEVLIRHSRLRQHCDSSKVLEALSGVSSPVASSLGKKEVSLRTA